MVAKDQLGDLAIFCTQFADYSTPITKLPIERIAFLMEWERLHQLPEVNLFIVLPPSNLVDHPNFFFEAYLKGRGCIYPILRSPPRLLVFIQSLLAFLISLFSQWFVVVVDQAVDLGADPCFSVVLSTNGLSDLENTGKFLGWTLKHYKILMIINLYGICI